MDKLFSKSVLPFYESETEMLIWGDTFSMLQKMKKESDPVMYKKLYSLLRKIFECHDVSDAEMEAIVFSVGLPVDHL